MKLKNQHLKWVKSQVKKAIVDYGMIVSGDRVAVGLSGGKDSMALLYLLDLIRREIVVNYHLHAIFINPGWPMNVAVMEDFCRQRAITFTNELTDIGAVVFEERQEKSPCALCANLRRGAINNVARELGLNKLALGHHLDDAIETFFMSLLYNGQFRTFSPVTFLDRSGITMIRPLIYLTNQAVELLVKRQNIPVVKSLCPVNKKTKREEMKQLVSVLSQQYPDLRHRFLNALRGFDQSNLWAPRVERGDAVE